MGDPERGPLIPSHDDAPPPKVNRFGIFAIITLLAVAAVAGVSPSSIAPANERFRPPSTLARLNAAPPLVPKIGILDTSTDTISLMVLAGAGEAALARWPAGCKLNKEL